MAVRGLAALPCWRIGSAVRTHRLAARRQRRAQGPARLARQRVLYLGRRPGPADKSQRTARARPPEPQHRLFRSERRASPDPPVTNLLHNSIRPPGVAEERTQTPEIENSAVRPAKTCNSDAAECPPSRHCGGNATDFADLTQQG